MLVGRIADVRIENLSMWGMIGIYREKHAEGAPR